MSTTHTPGPWKYNPNDSAIWPGPDAPRRAPVAEVFTAVDPTSETSPETISFTPEEEANGHLIAAAPELLAALHKLSANAAESAEWIRRVADEAIAKAEGMESNFPHSQ